MKLFIALIFGALVSIVYCSFESHESHEETKEDFEDKDIFNISPLDLRGTLKRSFAANWHPDQTEQLWNTAKHVSEVVLKFCSKKEETMLMNRNGNVVCSPLIALLPLGKLILGTEPGKSRTEMINALGVNKSSVKRKFKQLYDKLKYLQGVTLSVASRLFVSDKTSILKNYEQVTNAVFHSALEKINFKNPKAAATVINEWVSLQTSGLIKDIIAPSDISHDSKMILVNAIYFLGRWKNPFKTVFVGDFYSPVGKSRIPMMTQEQRYNYIQSKVLNAKIVELPYEGDQASFVIVLPESKTGLSMLLSELKLAPELLNTEMLKMRMSKVNLTMPKFKIETEINLRTLYEKVGVKKIFQKDSGLTRIAKENTMRLSKAIQKAYIEVSERGTEAAAANTIIIEHLKLERDIHVIVDHPFLFFVKMHREQIFVGIFNNPNKS